MNIQGLLKRALSHYLEFGDSEELRQILNAHPEVISAEYGEYPDMHRLMDLRIGDRNFRLCRQISQQESITLIPIEELFDTPGVPLWLTGGKLVLWATDEKENPSDEPIDWNRYR
ncbi:hypothetical protein HNQ59_003935 [Chitinivorax tropicus]|uniref:Uncharacterized protein n=1 Tax=Chitinivorax tropicus TaxID=714531 RepID=A0A840MQ94_9PROT|nr:hypothetical protein [Chitinivorax tropicus]MBB5020610.1 hypothetical protein [Chitinivorax tropicus]